MKLTKEQWMDFLNGKIDKFESLSEINFSKEWNYELHNYLMTLPKEKILFDNESGKIQNIIQN